MLVLTRKAEDEIVIGVPNDDDKIVITILKVYGEKVSIGIQAKEKYLIYRHELLKKDDKGMQEKELVQKHSNPVNELSDPPKRKCALNHPQKEII